MSPNATTADLKALDRAHVLYPWSAQGPLAPMMVSHSDGMYVYDTDGNEYLDFSSQLVNTNIGHSHPRVIQAIKDQADKMATIHPASGSEAKSRAAQLITEKAGKDFTKVFFTNGGADAIENAIRAARVFTGRNKVLSTYRSYHGNTGAAIAATGDWRRQPNEYAMYHVHFFGPFTYRSDFWSSGEAEEGQRALHHLERVIVSEGPQTIAAILLESVPGTAGIMVPPPGYLKGVRELCDRYGIVMILDEVMAGFGRTGYWFAHHAHDVTPDLITFAKGVNSGYVPVGGVVFSKKIADHFDDTMFPGGLTYSGHPLAMASIVATISAMEDENMVENAKNMGDKYLGPGLRALQEKYPMIGDVRGLGCFWALDLVEDRATKKPVDASVMATLKAELSKRKLLVFMVDNRIHVVPPLIVKPEHIEKALAIYDEAFAAVSS